MIPIKMMKRNYNSFFRTISISTTQSNYYKYIHVKRDSSHVSKSSSLTLITVFKQLYTISKQKKFTVFHSSLDIVLNREKGIDPI